MNKPLIDHHQAIAGLRQAVEYRGRDHVDPNAEDDECRYVSNVVPEPVCIVATALFKLGVPVSELKRWEGQNACALAPGGKVYGTSEGDDTLTDADGFVTPNAAQVLWIAQDTQDTAHTWGEALDAAEAEYQVITETEEQR